jgi:hypothetical protein
VPVFRPQGSTSRVLAELARLWDQAAVHSPGRVTQKNLARASGVPRATVNGWATGAAAPRDLDQLVKVGTTLAGWAKEPARSARAWSELMAGDRHRPYSADPPEQSPAVVEQVRVGMVPRLADCFQDRLVAARLERAIEEDGTVVLTQVLAGMGGVGKTQLAAAYARRAWRQSVGVLVWVNAATRDGVISAYADAALRLGLPLADRDDPERAAREFLTWAETTTDRWWLVVLDDLRSPGDLTELWPPTASSAAGGQVVVTTRLREAALQGVDRRMVQVGTFTGEEARSYLQAKLGSRAANTAQADALAEELGFLPLALAQAAAYILNADIDCAAYGQRLATHLLPHVFPHERKLPDDHQRIVTATWELSIDQADLAEPVGLARPVLYLASVLDPVGIPQAVLASPPALDYLTGYLPTPSEAPAVTPEMVDEALRVLHRHSLIDHDRHAIHREVRVHQLIQRATRENLATQPDLGPDLYAALADTAADALLSVWPPIERDQLGPILRANTTTLHQTTGAALWNPGTRGQVVLFRAATSLGETGQVSAAVAAWTDLHATAVQRLGADHRDTLIARGNLAEWRGEAGDAAGAAAALEELLADLLRVLGADHPHTLTARHNLAQWRGVAGDAAGAAAAFKELLADRLRVLGADHRDTLTTRGNLAEWRGRAGDAAGAAAAFKELLADRLRVLGADHRDTLGTRHNVASWRGQAGDAAGAAAATEELLADYLRVLGPDHPHTLIVRSNLVYWRGEAGDAAKAAAASEELLADSLRVRGPDHPHTLIVRSNLVYWRGQAGDAAGAAAATEELLADYLRVLGPDHPDTLAARHNLAVWQDRAGLG